MPTPSKALQVGPTVKRPNPSVFIPARIVELWKSHNINQAEFLRRVRLTWDGYNSIMHGFTKPNVRTLERIAAEFDVDCEYFFTRRGVTK